ncbi:MAG: hypothetical protein NTX45_08440 [Proteobacteria bacterium]|nr:hypothetical protein [Pseudomonadota bacterium]
MKNSYSQYTAEDLGELGISVTMQQLFDEIKAVNPSPWLLQTLAYNNALPTSTEKARSELLITPVLVELKQRNTEKISIFSGYPFDIDKKRGLKGFCDYLISNKHNAAFVESPVIAIVEVKKDQDLIDASPQCIAEMYAAQLFNQHHQENIPRVYGAVTSGYEWLFLRLEDNQVQIDYSRYFIQNLPELLGAWQTIIDSLCPTPPR